MKWRVNAGRVWQIGGIERHFATGSSGEGPVLYWMSREQRVFDNWSLLHAYECAERANVPLVVLFVVIHKFLETTKRQQHFMLYGLVEVREALKSLAIDFVMMKSDDPGTTVGNFAKKIDASLIVTDFDPLRVKQIWQKNLLKIFDAPVVLVDARNIVPCTLASSKEEYAAYTIRPKIKNLLPDYLEDYPPLKKRAEVHFLALKSKVKLESTNDVVALVDTLDIDPQVELKSCNKFRGGTKAALTVLESFINERLPRYGEERNNPVARMTSELSPYLHFGNISSLTIYHRIHALNGHFKKKYAASIEAFLEELIIRRELADNFCFYNRHYDSLEGAKEWALTTLNEHRKDKREFIYSQSELLLSNTHDPLWNAAQMQLVRNGKMHGYLRMYWAKKILEWSETAEEALKCAIYLNDKYSLDGHDSNGYTGILWAIAGVHDRAWSERPIFGKIRYMSYQSQSKKINVDRYLQLILDEGKMLS
ncbi:MAG: deoxyribodipyrimidine photo-lyase [Oligoflexia bacterium]|nr:deoxyribodipyrimidine photo-lyase [Oligoflexia bacterium]MBF0366830.1 deoxyribodipyrimidine photo-lyase [Oligoflexia bacterium]